MRQVLVVWNGSPTEAYVLAAGDTHTLVIINDICLTVRLFPNNALATPV